MHTYFEGRLDWSCTLCKKDSSDRLCKVIPTQFNSRLKYVQLLFFCILSPELLPLLLSLFCFSSTWCFLVVFHDPSALPLCSVLCEYILCSVELCWYGIQMRVTTIHCCCYLIWKQGSNVVNTLYDMLKDRDAMVVANCVFALNEILAEEVCSFG